jgi:putative Holliday junction resolvase
MRSWSPSATRPTTSRSWSTSFPRNFSEQAAERQDPRESSHASGTAPSSKSRPLDSIAIDHPILAIDYGKARIGLAATDPLGIAAHPVETIHLKNVDPFERIAAVVREREVKLVLLGLPLRLDGSEGDAARNVRAFGEKLTTHISDVPLRFTDERLTTRSAAEKLREAGKSSRQQKPIIDQAAALEILNDWLVEHE